MVKPNDAADLVEIVSSRVKAELFRILFGLGEPELHLRELVRQSGLSLGTVQQELRRLTRIGLVIRRKAGNRVYYRANAVHPLHGAVRELVLKTSGLVSVLAQSLDDPDIHSAFVFGSIASGNPGAESDVDLMVIGEIGLRRLTQMLAGVSEKVGREINPHVMSPNEFAERQRARDHFVTSVLGSPKLFIKGSEDELRAMGK